MSDHDIFKLLRTTGLGERAAERMIRRPLYIRVGIRPKCFSKGHWRDFRRVPERAKEGIKRAVSENARSLGLKSAIGNEGHNGRIIASERE